MVHGSNGIPDGLISVGRDEPPWLLDRRDEAERAIETLPMPDRADHRFRFTDPGWLWPPEETAAQAAEAEIEAAPPVVAGTWPHVLSRTEAAAAEFLGRLARPDNRFLAFNLARFASGAVVVVPEGARVEDPIRIRLKMVGTGQGTVSAARNLIVLGRGARARVEQILDVEGGLANVVTEVVVAEGARLDWSRFEAVGTGAAAFAHAHALVGRDAALAATGVLAPNGRLKAEAVTTLAGHGGRVDEAALILADHESHADLRVIADHAARDATSRITVRAVASGRGRAVFTGLLRVREGATGSEAYEEARGLVRSPQASADLLPELEILNHDVRASHGAAVGPLDEEARYYLMSRGLGADEAEAMLVRGFVDPVLDRLPSGLAARLPWAPLAGDDE